MNRLPRAIVVVHLYGQTADVRPIVDICKQFDLPLLEDAAEALGAQFQAVREGRPEFPRMQIDRTGQNRGRRFFSD